MRLNIYIYISAQPVYLEKTSRFKLFVEVMSEFKVRYSECVSQIRAKDLTDEDVRKLGEISKPPGLKFSNMGDFFPSQEANERGYGENTQVDPNEKQKIFQAIDGLVSGVDAGALRKQGLKKVQVKQIESILKDNFEAFGLETSIARMSKLTPIEVDLKPGHTPCLARGRMMPSQEEQLFLENKLADLTKMGIVRPAKNPIYGCIAFTVPKKGPKKWRMVIDMRPVKLITQKTALKLPHLEQQLGLVGQAKIFMAFDVLSGLIF